MPCHVMAPALLSRSYPRRVSYGVMPGPVTLHIMSVGTLSERILGSCRTSYSSERSHMYLRPLFWQIKRLFFQRLSKKIVSSFIMIYRASLSGLYIRYTFMFILQDMAYCGQCSYHLPHGVDAARYARCFIGPQKKCRMET